MMPKSLGRAALAALLSSLLFAVTAVAQAAVSGATFTGALVRIDTDSGTGTYSGAGVGDVFFGGFSYGLNAGEATFIWTEPHEANYEFVGGAFSGVLSNGITPVYGPLAWVNIQDDMPLTADEAALVGALLGTTVTAGTPVDVWAVGSRTAGAYYDVNNQFFNGVSFEMGLLSFNTGLYGTADFQAVPPPLGAVDLAIFMIEEADALGNTLFSAIGTLSTASYQVVPVPAAVWLLGSGLLGLIAVGRRG